MKDGSKQISPELLDKARKIIDEIEEELISFRHSLHEMPEIGLKEYNTSAAIRNFLRNHSIIPNPPYMETDVIALINPEKANNISLRADIDAIAQFEKNAFPYKSKIEGMMHACGHDGHTTVLAGTAIVLYKLKEYLPGSVRCIFQPGEEGLHGAEKLLRTDIFKDNKPSAILGFHNMPGMAENIIIGKTGVITSSITHIKIKILGESVHSSQPELGIDPILTATEIVQKLNNAINTSSHKLHGVNLRICKFHSGTNGNVIPDNAVLEGTARCFDRKLEEIIPTEIEKIVSEICNIYGAEYEVTIPPATPLVFNDKNLFELAKTNAKMLFGSKKWITKDKPYKFSEDFSEFERVAPSLYLGIGTGIERTTLHTQTFDFNDNIIKNAILFWIKMTFDILYKINYSENK